MQLIIGRTEKLSLCNFGKILKLPNLGFKTNKFLCSLLSICLLIKRLSRVDFIFELVESSGLTSKGL